MNKHILRIGSLFAVVLIAMGVLFVSAPTKASSSAPLQGPTTAPTDATPIAPAPATAAALQITQNSTLGNILTDGQGRTLYLFEKDTKNTSSCYNTCAANWPPFLPQGQPTLGNGVKSDLVGTTQRTDGSTQLTYNGWPLYYFAKDQQPGDAKGQGVGDVWYTVTPSGESNEPTAVPATGAMLKITQNATLGNFITDAMGRTLYLYTKDTKNTSNCYDACATAWPPLLSQAQPTLGDGLKADLLGTTTRKDGSTQLTYNGWPLYYYAKDQQPGDVNGQNVGKVWFVINPAGDAIMTNAAPVPPSSSNPAPAIKVAQNATLGTFLVDGQGRTLYLYTKDTKNTSNCYDACATAWPPLMAQGQPVLGEGLKADLLGTTTRKDGSTQLTYNGWPLYYYAKDQQPGDVNGQNVGKVWFVLTPAGDAVMPSAAPAPAPSNPSSSYPSYP